MIIITGRRGTGKRQELFKRFITSDKDSVLIIGEKAFFSTIKQLEDTERKHEPNPHSKRAIVQIGAYWDMQDFIQLISDYCSHEIYIMGGFAPDEKETLEEIFFEIEEENNTLITIIETVEGEWDND